MDRSYIKKRRWRDTKECTTLESSGKQKRGRPRNSWRRSVIMEAGRSWNELRFLAADRQKWKGLIDSLCMKREDQQDATIRCLLLTSVSTCFWHHYAHLQENKGPVTAFGVLFWLCCLVLCEQCSHPTTQRPTTATNHIQQNQNNTPNAVTGPLFPRRWA